MKPKKDGYLSKTILLMFLFLMVACNRANHEVQMHLEAGDDFFGHNEFQSAVDAYTAAIEVDGRSYEAYIKRAQVYERLRQNDEAISDYNEAVLIEPTKPDAYLSRGEFHFNNNEWELAHSDLDEAIRLDSQNATAYLQRGRIRVLLGNLGGALEDFDASLALESENPQSYFLRGSAYEYLGNNEAALADYKQYEKLAVSRTDKQLAETMILNLQNKMDNE